MKIKSLEGLRGIAALNVVIFHFFFNFYPAIVDADLTQLHTYNGIEAKIAVTPLNVIYNGSFAVYIFFVLSGFVLSYKYFKTGDSTVITASAIRRYFRLMIPALFSVLCVYFFYSLKFPWVTNYIADFSIVSSLREGIYASLFSGINNYNPVMWTMHYEFFGSFLVFGFCLIFGSSRNRIWCYILAIFIFWNTPYLAFILGMSISDLMNNYNIQIKRKAVVVILWIVGLFLGSYTDVVEPNDTMYSFFHFLKNPSIVCHTIGAAILIIALLNSKKSSEILSNSFFQFLGRISFSMYLTHVLTITFLSHHLFDYLHVDIGMRYKYSFAVTFAISITTIFIFAYLMEKYVDRYAVRFSGFVYNRFFKKPETIPVKTKPKKRSSRDIDLPIRRQGTQR